MVDPHFSMISTVAVVLHGTQGVTFDAYLVRVLVYLLAFAAVSVTTFGTLRAIEIIRTAPDGER